MTTPPERDDPTRVDAENGDTTSIDTARGALVIGEALVDVVRRPDGTVGEFPGGSPANVALGLSRLGRPVDLLTWFGEDPYGTLIVNHLTASGVRIVPGSDKAARSSSAQATLNDEGAASYVFDLEWQLPHQDIPDRPRVVHTGSIGAVLTPGGARVRELLAAARPNATITYDPNLRPALMPDPAETGRIVEQFVALADVVKVSDEDLAWLRPGEDPVDVAAEWLAFESPSVVIVTMGGEGSVALCAAGRLDIPAPRTEVADTVGAGDSYMGGLIDGLWSADLLGGDRRAALASISIEQLTKVLTWAARIAAITVSRPGANPPTARELDES